MIYGAPCKPKYIDETFHNLIIFGEYPNGTVDVCDENGSDYCQAIPRELAEKIVEAHNESINKVNVILNGNL